MGKASSESWDKQGSYCTAKIFSCNRWTTWWFAWVSKMTGQTKKPYFKLCYIRKIQTKGRKNLSLRKCVFDIDWRSSHSCIKTTYQAMVSSCLQYPVPVWAHAASNLSKLDKVQNNATKIAKNPKDQHQ